MFFRVSLNPEKILAHKYVHCAAAAKGRNKGVCSVHTNLSGTCQAVPLLLSGKKWKTNFGCLTYGNVATFIELSCTRTAIQFILETVESTD